MDVFLAAVAVFLAGNLAVGGVRLLAGPSTLDRLLAVLLAGTTGVALLVVLAALAGEPALRTAALVLALFSVVLVLGARRDGPLTPAPPADGAP